MKKEDLLKMIGEDELGLLSVKPTNSSAITADERLISSFEEINSFVQENNREPEGGKEIQEHRLSTRLKSIREDQKKCEALLAYDRHDLLNIKIKEVNSVNDIFESDDLGILDSGDENLFALRHVPKTDIRKSADYIARRKPCKNFGEYESLFEQCHADLLAGKRKLKKFTSEREVQKDGFFVLNGILLKVVDIGKTYIDKHGKINGRQKCVFENGTESEMLVRSLVQRLYENGQIVTESVDTDEQAVMENFGGITKDDTKTGFIYVLKTLSGDPRMQGIENLYKIGFSKIPVEERIKNAAEDPTYLMAPVSIVTTFECYNLNPQKLEQLLHTFFGSACLNVDIFDKKGQRHTPREWFIAPLHVIEKSIELIISGGVLNYRYDAQKEDIVLK